MWIIPAVVGALLLARFVARTLLERWWFSSLGQGDIWRTSIVAQLQLLLVVGFISGGLLAFTVRLVLRTEPVGTQAPVRLALGYHERMGPAHRWLVIGTAGLVTWRMARDAMGWWQIWLLFRHGGTVGVSVPELGGDLGDYLFRLPFYAALSGWLTRLLTVALLIAVLGHLATGALQPPGRGRRSSPIALRHVAFLIAGLALVRALTYVMVNRPGFATNRDGAFDGPGYTQLRVGVPSTWVLAAVTLIVGGLFVAAAVTGRWRPALVGVGVWAALHLTLVFVLPAVVQRFVVAPAEAARELTNIEHNLDATTAAYRLDLVERQTREMTDGVESEPTAEQQEDLARIPVFGPTQLGDSLQVLQGTPGTRIRDVDLDRYEVDDVLRPVLVAPRNASRTDLPEQGWVQEHLVYTHGDGLVLVPADVPGADGRPDVDALASLQPERPELYFGEGLDGWYAIVGTERSERGGARFDADTGIELSSTWRRAVVAVSTGDIEPLVSAEITDESQLLWRRGLDERLKALAPFLSFDGDPYPIIVDDHVVWVTDGYTVSSNYPYAQFAPTESLPGTSDLAGRSFNYLHSAVKATIDAYDGTVHLYRSDLGRGEDPILDAWIEVFPDLIEPSSSMPDELRTHQRFPVDLLTVQSNLLGRYHVTDAETLFNGTERWNVAIAASEQVGQPSPGLAPIISEFLPSGEALAGDWVSIRPYQPGAASNPTSGRAALSGFVVADNDDPERLVLVTTEPATERQLSSPQVAQSVIDADPELARLFTLLNANGSKVQFGPMTPVVLDDALTWIRSVIVSGTAGSSVPRLYSVLAVSNGLVGQGEDASSALAAAVEEGMQPEDVVTTAGTGPEPP